MERDEIVLLIKNEVNKWKLRTGVEREMKDVRIDWRTHMAPFLQRSIILEM